MTKDMKEIYEQYANSIYRYLLLLTGDEQLSEELARRTYSTTTLTLLSSHFSALRKVMKATSVRNSAKRSVVPMKAQTKAQMYRPILNLRARARVRSLF